MLHGGLQLLENRMQFLACDKMQMRFIPLHFIPANASTCNGQSFFVLACHGTFVTLQHVPVYIMNRVSEAVDKTVKQLPPCVYVKTYFY